MNELPSQQHGINNERNEGKFKRKRLDNELKYA